VHAIRSAAAAKGTLSADELSRFAARDVLVAREITEPAVGTVVGVGADGALVVDTAAGRQFCRSGSVRSAEDR
jgi:hypothetical protein